MKMIVFSLHVFRSSSDSSAIDEYSPKLIVEDTREAVIMSENIVPRNPICFIAVWNIARAIAVLNPN